MTTENVTFWFTVYCVICGAIVGIAGLITAWGLLGWLANRAWLGTLQRLGTYGLFFMWCRHEFRQGRQRRLYRWIFDEDLPAPDADHS